VLLLGGCGRSPLAHDGGRDLRPPDQGAPGEGARPCAPTCAEICSLRKSCALLPKAGYDSCVDACEAAPALPTNLCLGQIVCREGTTSCKEVEGCVTSPTLPDLVLGSFVASSLADGQLALSVRVCNQGSADALPSTLHLYLNRSVAPALKEAGDRVLKLGGLAAGACVERASTESVAGGSYSSWAQVDAENAVLESSEANNVAGPAFTQVGGKPLPDLVVTSLLASASGGGATYVARVCNTGSAPSGATQLDLYVHRPSAPPPGAAGDAELAVQPLLAGSCQQLTATGVTIVGAGTKSSWAYVDRQGGVVEHSESNNVYGPVSLQAEELPDLVIASVTVSDAGGNTAAFSATICNQGLAASTTPVDLSFYPSRASAPDASSLPTLSKTIGPLAAGVCTLLSWYHGYPSPGVYSAWLWLDRLGVQAESDEKNLHGPIKVAVGGGPPDLTVSLSASVGASGVVSYTATVCNKGTGASPPAGLDLYYHAPSPPPPFQSGDQSSSVPPIAPGDCAAVKLIASLATGTYLSRAWVDRSGYVQETVENNNLCAPLTVSVNAGNGPDLVIGSFSTFVNANNVYYYLSVCNAGTGYSAVSAVEIYHNRATPPTATTVGDQTKSVISLGVGGCTPFTFVTTLPKGSYQAWAYVDRVDVAKETNETNNLKGPLTVTVSGGQGVDLVVSALSYNTASGTYSVTVCNKGGGTSWASTVDLYYNRTTAPKTTDWGNASLPFASLAGGACTTLSHSAKLTPGSYSSWAQVDRFAQVPESDEGNNVYGPLLFSVGVSNPCPTICDALVSPCALLPQAQHTACVSTCQAAGQTKIDCALQALAQGKCLEAISCLFS
jgi:subtilase family serine protease